MKKILFLAMAVLMGIGTMAQKCEVISSDYQKLVVSFTASENLQIGNEVLFGHEFNTVSLDGFDFSSEIGVPMLPTLRKMIEIPLCSGMTVEIVTENHIVVDGSEIGASLPVKPVQPSLSKSASKNVNRLVMNEDVYSANRFCGREVVTTEEIGVARDRNLAQVVFSPVQYNPVTNQFVVYTSVEAVVRYTGADKSATEQMKRLHHSPAFGNGLETINSLGSKDVSLSAPMRYLIVSNPMFRGELDEFVNWKRRTGFIVDVAYTDQAEVGSAYDDIKSYVHRQYAEATPATPAPSFVLFVGDVEQLPTKIDTNITSYFGGWWIDTAIQASDLYYACWTDGDNIPDCYYGRLSAQTVEQLQPQLQKTLLYERYEFPDPSFLDVAMLVSGIDQGSSNDHGYTHCDPTMDYIAKFYVNGDYGYSNVYEYKNKTSINPNAPNVTVSTNATSAAAAIRTKYSQGAGWINYSAHGDWDRWHSPELTNTQVNQMTNQDKCGIMIGNCCLTGKFDEPTCFAEALLRKGNNSGAAAYIGASNSTYWDQDFYWAIGVRTSISGNMTHQYMANNLGVYDRLFHTHDEEYPVWATTLGAMMFNGNMAVENSGSSADDKLYYWQIYHTFGDPSLMPWLTQAEEMTFEYSGMYVGSTSVTALTEPHAYVALTAEDYTLLGAAFADATGLATITLPQALVSGNYVIAATAQNRQPRLVNVNVTDATVVTYILRVVSDNETMGRTSGSGSYGQGETATISASSNEGYHFFQWNDGNTEATRTVTVTGDATYTAFFEANAPEEVYYTVTVLSDDEIMGEAFGSGQYLENSMASISAVARDGYRFTRWNDGNTEATRTITVTDDMTFTAYFEQEPQNGIGDVVAGNVRIYPNPTSGWFTIEADGIQNIEIIDAVGRVVLRQTEVGNVDMSQFAHGVYTVRVTANGATAVKKVVRR